MTETLIAPENEPFPNRRRWTRAECAKMAEMGFLTGRYELIDGEVLSKMGQNAPHSMTIILTGQWLTAVFAYLFVRAYRKSLSLLKSRPLEQAYLFTFRRRKRPLTSRKSLLQGQE